MLSKERNIKNIARFAAISTIIGSAVACGEANQQNYSEPTLVNTTHTLNLNENEIKDLQKEEAINYLVSSFQTPIPIQPTPEIIHKSSTEPVSEELLSKYKSEIPEIFKKIESHPELFNTSADEEDLAIYYPIYRAAQDKFGVEWYTLWIIHSQESSVSRNPIAFEEGRMHIGAMQRSPESHPQKDVDRYFQGLEYLNSIPTRNITDAKEIIYAGASISENTNITGSLLGALYKYSAAAPAESRYRRYLVLNSVFSQ